MAGFFYSQQVMGHADLKTSLTYLRGLEIPEIVVLIYLNNEGVISYTNRSTYFLSGKVYILN